MLLTKSQVFRVTNQLIQDFCNNLLSEYLPLLKTSIACICNLLVFSKMISLLGQFGKRWEERKSICLFKWNSIPLRINPVDSN